MRLFELQRTGRLSGFTLAIAEGCLFSNGRVAISTLGCFSYAHPPIETFDSMQDLQNAWPDESIKWKDHE